MRTVVGTVALTLVDAGSLLRSESSTSADHAHHFKALDRSGRGLHGLKASRRSNDAFESTVVGLDDVVEILARAMLCVGRHCSFSLQPGDRFGIGSEVGLS